MDLRIYVQLLLEVYHKFTILLLYYTNRFRQFQIILSLFFNDITLLKELVFEDPILSILDLILVHLMCLGIQNLLQSNRLIHKTIQLNFHFLLFSILNFSLYLQQLFLLLLQLGFLLLQLLLQCHYQIGIRLFLLCRGLIPLI